MNYGLEDLWYRLLDMGWFLFKISVAFFVVYLLPYLGYTDFCYKQYKSSGGTLKEEDWPGPSFMQFNSACCRLGLKISLVVVQVFCWVSPTFQVSPLFTTWPMVIVTFTAAGVVIILSGAMLLGITADWFASKKVANGLKDGDQ